MGRYIADVNQVTMIAESGTYGTKSGNGVWIGQVQDHSPDETFERAMVRYQGADTRNVSSFVDTKTDLAGTLNYYPQNYRLLGYALGKISDGGAAGSYTHTLTEANSDDLSVWTSGTKNPFASFTIEDAHKHNPTGLNFIRTFAGCVIDSFTITAPAGDLITCEAGYIAQSVAFSSGAETAVTAATDRPNISADSKVHFPSGTIYDDVTEWSLTINNNIDARHYANGSKEIGVPIPTTRDYELSLTMDSTSEKAKTLYDQYYKGGSVFNALVSIDVSAPAKHTVITLSGCEITAMDTPSPVEGVDEHTITVTPKECSAITTDTIEKYSPW